MQALAFLLMVFISLQMFGQDHKIRRTDLVGCWTDSREENDSNSDIAVYRPCDFKEFPPSRFRFRMDLRKDNTCLWLYLDPTDAHSMKEGTWSFNDGLLEIFDMNNEKVMSFDIKEVHSDMLKIKN